MINKELQKQAFSCGNTPNANDFADVIDSTIGVLTNVMQLPPPSSALQNTCYKIGNVFYTCTNNGSGGWLWATSEFGTGVKSYNSLSDKPAINGGFLSGNRDGNAYGLLNSRGNYPFVTPNPRDAIFMTRGATPLMARVQDFLSSINRNQVVVLEDVTNVSPVITDAVIGVTSYFNTDDNLIYVANTVSSWSPQGISASGATVYINRANSKLYYYDNDTMIMISEDGGGGGGGTGENGATFTPIPILVSTNKLRLEWTNDKELGNPPTVEIVAPQGNPGIVQAGNPFDYLITGPGGNVVWITGMREVTFNIDNGVADIDDFAKRYIINYDNPGIDLTIKINRPMFDYMQDFTIVIYNNRKENLIVNIQSDGGFNLEWKNLDDDYSFEIPANKTMEISFMPYMVSDSLRVRGIIG